MITLAQIGPNLKATYEAAMRAEGEAIKGGASARKAEFVERLKIDQQKHADLIRRRIRQLYQTTEIAELICNHVDTRRNVLRRVAAALAVAYDTPPTREVAGASTEEQRGMSDAYREAHTATEAESWGRYAVICNVVHVLPRIVGNPGRLQWVTVLPHACDVLFDPNGEVDPSILIYDTNEIGARRIAVDSERWVWLDKNWNVIHHEEHGLGMTPWAEFRVAPRGIGDYWARGMGHDLVDATLEAGRIAAHMAWTRKNNSQKLLIWNKDNPDSEIPPGQSDATKGIVVRNVGVNVYDTEVSPESFQSELDNLLEEAAEAYGLDVGEIDPSRGAEMSPRRFERLVKERNRQIKHLVAAETKLAVVTSKLLRRANRPAPDPDMVSTEFRVRFAPATYADHPKAQVETAQKLMEVGATDPYEFYQQLNPGLTYEEAREEVLQHLDARGEFNDILATRNMSSDPSTDVDSLPQAQGRIGGRMSAETRNNPAPSDDGQIESEDVES